MVGKGEVATVISMITKLIIPQPVAQLVEHQVIVLKVMSSTPAGPTLRVLK